MDLLNQSDCPPFCITKGSLYGKASLEARSFSFHQSAREGRSLSQNRAEVVYNETSIHGLQWAEYNRRG